MRLGPGWATGVGSLPGTDIHEAVRIVAGELPELPHLPELPARGPGADMIGRGAAVLVGLAVETTVTGWRLSGAPGREARRATSYLSEDLDALEEALADAELPVKIAVAGPWTLAAAIELTYGDKALADAGACRDLAASLSQGVSELLAGVRKRLPRAQLLLQLDEPSVPSVLAGAVRTASGFGRLGAVEEPVVVAALRAVVEAAGDVPVVVHCCAGEPPLELFVRAGAAALSWDLTLNRSEAARRSLEEQVATAVEAGEHPDAGLDGCRHLLLERAPGGLAPVQREVP